VGYQLELGALVTRQLKPDLSRKQNPAELWVTITVEVIVGFVGVMVFFFGRKPRIRANR
jgi:hypothetical protein